MTVGIEGLDKPESDTILSYLYKCVFEIAYVEARH